MINDISELESACAKRFCPWCGSPVTNNGNGRPRTFCSDRCRWAFDKHRTRMKAKEIEIENSRIKNDTGEGSEAGRIQPEEETETWR